MEYSESLKKNRDFQVVYRQGTSCANRYLVMYVKENHLEKNRIGISVSKKVGNSVVRHRLTRLIRESYRLNEQKFRSGLDIVVVARVNAKGRSCQEIEKALLHLGRLQKILNKKKEKSSDSYECLCRSENGIGGKDESHTD
ncbi:MAG: ribonuclease P protein component [Lachnospiraceae bacterium]|nr:ribonuclease P protein component [Lachnospiraceae bacterium]